MLKPVEDKRSVPGSAIAKIGFVVLLIIAGIFMSNNNPPAAKSKPSKSKPAVLGETIVNEVKGVGSAFNSFRVGTTKKVSGFVQSKKDQATSKATDFVYTTGIDPVLDNFSKLPKSDQARIKKELCK